MNCIIRPETASDYRAVEEVTREAFWNLYVPGCDEHFLVHTMRNHGDFLPELSFVAECDGTIVGAIFYTKSHLISQSGKVKEITTFGPLCVDPTFQRQGIGSQLIEHTLAMVKARGVDAIAIYGDPHNYCKHGFKNGKEYGISDKNGEFPYGLLVLALSEEALTGEQWQFIHSPVYDEIDGDAAEIFDRSFTTKQKKYHYTQEIFSIAIRSFLK